MKAPEFMDRLFAWVRGDLAAKCTSPMTAMAVGAASCGVGRRIVESNVAPYLALCAGPDGELDVPGIRESALAGFNSAKSVPVLGGAISLDAQDARDFFATLPE